MFSLLLMHHFFAIPLRLFTIYCDPSVFVIMTAEPVYTTLTEKNGTRHDECTLQKIITFRKVMVVGQYGLFFICCSALQLTNEKNLRSISASNPVTTGNTYG